MFSYRDLSFFRDLPRRAKLFASLFLPLLVALAAAPPAQAARVLAYETSPKPTVTLTQEPSLGRTTLELEITAQLEVRGRFSIPDLWELPTQFFPSRLRGNGRWSYKDQFTRLQTSPEISFCESREGARALIFGKYEDCEFENETTFYELPPDTTILIQHALKVDEEPDNWSTVTFQVGAEISTEPGGVGGSVSAGGSVEVNASDILAKEETFYFQVPKKTEPCPVYAPMWNVNLAACQACPEEKPIWNAVTKQCDACPQERPYFNGETCAESEAQECPERMIWNEQQQECVCKSNFMPYRATPTSPLECKTRFELRDILGTNSQGPVIDIARPPGDGTLAILRCVTTDQFRCTEYYDAELQRMIVECDWRPVMECEWTFIRLKNGVDPGPPRKACHDGLGWQPCDDDPWPQVPMPAYPELDLESILGPCYTVGNQQVTPCTSSTGGATGGASGGSSAQPDLQVSLLSLEGSTIRPGDVVELRARVVNTGGTTAANSVLWIHWTPADGVTRFQRLWIGSLAAGASRDLTARSDSGLDQPFTALAGPLEVSVTADGEQEITEASETNNGRSLSLWVAEGPAGGANLRPSWIEVLPDHPVEGSVVTFRYAIDNIGDQPAAASHHGLRLTRPNGTHTVETRSTPALQPGQEWIGELMLSMDESGPHTFYVESDVLDAVIETVELDNTLNRPVTVAGNTECLPCTTGTANFIGAEVCLDGSGGIPETGEQWRCMGVRFDGSSCVANGNHPNGWQYVGDRCPPASMLCAGELHPDRCGTPAVCPGTLPCP